MGSFPEAYNDPTWIIIRRLSNHFCGRNIEIFWTYYIIVFSTFFKSPPGSPAATSWNTCITLISREEWKNA